MNVKKAFTCMLTLLLVFAFFGCDQVFNPGDSGDTGIIPPPPYIDGGTEPGTGENPDDTWTEITSLDGLEGTWEAKGRVTTQRTGTVEIHQAIIYPVDGVDSSNKPVKDGVLFKFLDGGGSDFYVEKNVFEDGTWAKEIWDATSGTYYTNHLQSELKIVLNFDKSKEIESASDWIQHQKDTIYSGDFFVSYSENFPYIETHTIIYHKTSESTNPGENPDPGTDPNPGTGTEPGTGENPNDTWTEVTSLTGLEGTWLAKEIGTEKDSTTGELRSSPLYVSITYPFSGRNGNGVEIKDGVRVRMIDGLAVEDYIMVPDDFFNFVQKPGVIPFPLPEERESSNVKVNQSKTELKTEVVIIAPETITTKEDWEKINQEGPSLSGDMFLSFVEGSPCTITGTVIFHKVDANTNIGTEPGTGENPDDTWTKITSFDGLDGTWKASYITKVPSSNFETVESVPVELLMAYPYWGTGEEGQEIVNGVGFGIFLNGVGQPTRILSKDELESILKTGTNGGVATELYINSTRTELKEVRSQEAKIPNSEPSNGSPIKDDTEWEQYKLQRAPYLPEGDMKITFSAGAPYTVTTTQILHKQ